MQEGEKTTEDPAALKQELDCSLERLTWLITQINLTNSTTVVDGKTLTQIIAEKDVLSRKIDSYKNIVSSASSVGYRARGTEIRVLSAISVPDWQAEVDAMSKELRLLDNKLQASNWSTELIEQ